jgi:glutathione S-transferase
MMALKRMIGEQNGEISTCQLQNLPLGPAGSNRFAGEEDRLRIPPHRTGQPPDWFLAISPHKKVPVLRVNDSISLFESNAMAEYLDATVMPRLHPNDPVGRAVNRAWTDYVPTFAETVTGGAYADTEADYNKAVEKIPVPFERLERALTKQGGGPLFNGEHLLIG